jgi:hypothetical protein
MPRLRQNDRERAVGMVQAGMTHQAVADQIIVFGFNIKIYFHKKVFVAFLLLTSILKVLDLK